MYAAQISSRVWSIILSGGSGERLRPFVTRWLGTALPKQYCSFVGTRSMLQHTLDRADRLSPPQQKVTVIAKEHGTKPWSQIGKMSPGTVVVQPENRDTAAGIFLPLTYVRARNPHATVVIYPSDHFVYPEAKFVQTVRRAISASERLLDRVILLGVRPDDAEVEYGWIQPGYRLGETHGHAVSSVESFVEKPGRLEAMRAKRNGALWNTFVVVSNVDTLWRFGKQLMPECMERFEHLAGAIGTPFESAVLTSIYQDMPTRNFSTLLQETPDRVACMELRDVLWSDWGRPSRIEHTLSRLGKIPNFALAQAA